MFKTLVTTLLLGFLAFQPALAEAKKPPKPPPTPAPVLVEADLTAANWTTYSSTNSWPLANNSDGDLVTTLPTIGQTNKFHNQIWLGYIFPKSQGYDISDLSSITVDFDYVPLTGNPSILYDDGSHGGFENNCDPLLRPDTWVILMAGSGYSDSDTLDRWWCHPTVYEQIGQPYSVTCDVTQRGTTWTDAGIATVTEAQRDAGFEAITHNARIGITLSGGCFGGVGVATTNGTVQVRVKSIRGNP